jgi:hypothetical protein
MNQLWISTNHPLDVQAHAAQPPWERGGTTGIITQNDQLRISDTVWKCRGFVIRTLSPVIQLYLFIWFLFLVGLGFELGVWNLHKAGAAPLIHFGLIILEMEGSQTTCLDWPQISILLISASQVDRITVVSHRHPANFFFFFFFFFLWDKVLLCSPDWPWTHNPTASASQVLGLQICTTTSSST